MIKSLNEIAYYVKDKISAIDCNNSNYISTDNMLVEKQGITFSDYVPNDGLVCSYKKGDILISNIRPYFKKIWLADKDGGCSGDILVFRAKEGYSSEFLYSVLSQDDFFRYVMQGATGSKMPRGDKNHILKYKINIPDNYNEIGKMICKINEKINLNNKTANALNKFIKEMFSYYFGSMCINENKTIIKNYLSVLGGYSFDANDYTAGKYDVITIKNVNDLFVDEYNCDHVSVLPKDIKEFQILDIGNILVSLTGKTGRISIVDKNNELLNQRVGKIESTKDIYIEFNYCLLNSDYVQNKIQNLSTGGNQKNLSPEDLVNVEIDIVSDEEILRFHNNFNYIYKTIIDLGVQNEYFKKLLNSLAPLLLNNTLKLKKEVI